MPSANTVHLERYEKFVDLHEKWDVEAYSIGNALKRNFLMRIMLPFMMSRSLVRLKQYIKEHPEFRNIYLKKIQFLVDRFDNVRNHAAIQEAEDGAIEILSLLEEWLSEPGARYVLGADSDYSLGDVFATTFLVRLQISG